MPAWLQSAWGRIVGIFSPGGPKKERTRSFIYLGIASLAWVGGALAVALPEHIYPIDLSMIIRGVVLDIKHPLTILGLLLLDVVIASWILQEERMTDSIRYRLGTFLGCGFLFGVTAIVVPGMDGHGEFVDLFWVGVVALIFLVVVRSITYATVGIAKDIPPGT